MKKRNHWSRMKQTVGHGEISAGVPPYDSDVTNKSYHSIA